jgi:hypothetical protein
LNFITQLLPGLRDVRGPLIAGYLWLFAGWLLLADRLPHRGTDDIYRHAFEVGEALGRVGLAAVVSVAAYLIGSLQQAIIGSIDSTYESLKQRIPSWIRVLWPSSSPVRVLPSRPVGELLDAPPIFALDDFRLVDGDQRTKRALEDLVSKELRTSKKDLDDALGQVVEGATTGPAAEGRWSPGEIETAGVEVRPVETQRRRWAVRQWTLTVGDHTVGKKDETDAEESPPPLPSFSARRDLFEERSTIQTRLMETTEHAGSEVERLYAESDFRFTIAFPLALVAFVLTIQSQDKWWLVLVGAALGLLMHAIVLRQHGGREMVEALRSRPDREKLNQITPAFSRYEQDAVAFAEAVANVQWEAPEAGR